MCFFSLYPSHSTFLMEESTTLFFLSANTADAMTAYLQALDAPVHTDADCAIIKWWITTKRVKPGATCDDVLLHLTGKSACAVCTEFFRSRTQRFALSRLCGAVYANRFSIVDECLLAGAGINDLISFGTSTVPPLCFCETKEMVAHLIKAGADPGRRVISK
jgi:hypothetical protein